MRNIYIYHVHRNCVKRRNGALTHRQEAGNDQEEEGVGCDHGYVWTTLPVLI